MIMGNKQRGSDGRFVSVDSVDLEGSLSADSPMAKVLAGASAVSDVAEDVATEGSVEVPADAGHDEVSGDVPAEGASTDMPTDVSADTLTDVNMDALDGMPLGVLESDDAEGEVGDVAGDVAEPVEVDRPRSSDVRRSDVRSLIASRRSESERRMGTETKGFGARAVVASRKAGSSLGSARSVIRDRLSGNLRGGVGGSKCTTKVIG